MGESYYVGAYWDARKETAEACARRASLCLGDLARLEGALSHWYRKGKAAAKAQPSPIGADEASLAALLQGGRNRKDADRSVIPELGFSAGLWTGGAKGESVGLSLCCGGYSPYVSNSCVLELPTAGEAASRMLTSAFLEKVLRVLVERWDPRRAIATSFESDAAAGWLTYVRATPDVFSDLASSCRVAPAGPGTLIVLTEELFSARNPAHLKSAKHLSEALSRR
jgi:hypothetical protein